MIGILKAPDLTEYRFALYCRSDLVDLGEAGPPVALYRVEALADAHGQAMWPGAYTVIDLHGEDSPCGNPS